MKPSAIDFQPYLRAIAHLYSQQNALYTPTDALLPLEVRSVERQDTQQPQERQVEQFPVLTGLRKYALGENREHVLLAGRPGSGKSTALKQLAIALAEEGQVPVLVQLKGDRTVPELIQAEFRRAKQRVTLEQIEDWLLADRLILLLDGVNEIPNDDLRCGLAQFREDNSTVPMIFTTRELAVGGDLGIDKRLEMKPLSESQMREFVKKYLPEQGEQLLGQLRDRLREIAETPLFLKMLCDVFRQTREIPQNKGELFRQFDRNYERLKKDYVPVSKNFWEFKSEVLQHLAFSMIQADVQKPTDLWLTISKHRAESLLENWLHQRGVVDAPTKAKEWLKDLCNHHLLQDAAKPGEIEFHHQLFQEYYAAEYLLQLLPSLSDEQLKRDYLNYLKWTEAIALMLALPEITIEQTIQVIGLSLSIDLKFGAQFVCRIKPDFQDQVIRLITELSFPKHLKTHLLEMTRSDSAITFLTPVQELRTVAALGQFDSDFAVNALLQILNGSNSLLRWWAARALGNIHRNAAITILIQALNDRDDLVRDAAATSLGNIGGSTAFDALVSALDDPHPAVRDAVIEALGKIATDPVVHILDRVLKSKKYSKEHQKVAKSLGKIHSDAAVRVLLYGLKHKSIEVRRTAVSSLEEIGSAAAKEALVYASKNQNAEIRLLATNALTRNNKNDFLTEIASPKNYTQEQKPSGNYDNESLLQKVLLNIQRGNYEICGRAAKENYKLALFLSKRKILSESEKYFLDSVVLNEFHLLNDDLDDANFNISDLVEILEKESDDLYLERATRALALLASQKDIPELLRVQKIAKKWDGYIKHEVCEILVEALIELKDEKALPGLFLELTEYSFRPQYEMAIKALEELSSETVTRAALEALNLECYFFASIEALVRFGNPMALFPLWKKILEGPPYIEPAHLFPAIAAIQNRCKYYNHEIAHGLIPQGQAIALFFSYASKDEALQNELAKHLNLLERQGVITSWDSRQILPGDEREQVISRQLNTADIILLLISSDSIADDTCYDLEIRRAMERHQAGEAHVIPILLRSVDWMGAPFSQLDVLPKNKQPVTTWDNRDEAFRQVAEGIRAVAIALRRENSIKGA